MAKVRFKPGNAGRPKGAKNKNYVDASYWLGRADELINKIENDKNFNAKLAVIKWATELIASRVPMVSTTQQESVANALAVKKAADDFVKTLETETSDASPA